MNIDQLQQEICPHDHTTPWTIGSGGSWDSPNVRPISDELMAQTARLYQYTGTPWNCRYLPLLDADREYMFLLYYAYQGLTSRVREADREIARLQERVAQLENEQDASNPT